MNARSRTVLVLLVIISLLFNGTLIFAANQWIWGRLAYVDSMASSGQAPQVDGTLQGYYGQKPQWRPCATSEINPTEGKAPRDRSAYECATLTAPLDWDVPAGETITLAIAVHRAPNAVRSGGIAPALFYNLGGPGGAAVSSIVSQVRDSLGSRLVDAYDIVALDPRGVGASTPVRCRTDKELDEDAAGDLTAPENPTLEERIRLADESSRRISSGCQNLSGNIYQHVDTVSAARDFDMVRAVMGQETLNYLGYSYGTFLGATYAGLFPDKVGRFVLDGALDPAMGGNEVSDLQMRGFEASITHWIEDCQAGAGCPLTGGVTSGIEQMKNFLDGLKKTPLKTSDPDRPLTNNLALSAIIGLMYSTKTYSTLTQAMSMALEDRDGSALLYVADLLAERESDGTHSSNSADAIIAINQLDFSSEGTPEQWEASAKKLREDLPILGSDAGYASAGVDAWPTTHAQRHPITAEGAPPIVVIGTLHDPATPYVMAENLAKQLSSGVLVSWDGWNHTAYSKDGSACVIRAVENYFLDNTVPENGLFCSAW